MDYKFLKIDEKENGVIVLTISREKTLNSLNTEVLKELSDFFEKIFDDEATSVIVLTGAGKSFVAGADIGEMATLSATEGYDFGKLGMDTLMKIEKGRKPVIAAVNGYALGGGCEIALACDIRLASKNAKFGQPEVGLGIIPGFGGTQRLIRAIGPGYAKEMIFTAKMIDAERAERWGLVNHVYEPEELLDKAIEMANTIAQRAPKAIQYSKSAIESGSQTDIETAMEIERTSFGLLFSTEDQREGMNAFLNKKQAKFSGK
ncbi:enoyl-CoA hydratase-related protein [Peptoniphilus raoultii]|uniref:enoyl-CoA hydratase-related protein n=1 Tax=Peptoniphilus raoultii TaxID=1776387 RepID=UPI0008D914F5|nr:enoyl-CoA hydratase-related protein [Peptoniphilus raoultii]